MSSVSTVYEMPCWLKIFKHVFISLTFVNETCNFFSLRFKAKRLNWWNYAIHKEMPFSSINLDLQIWSVGNLGKSHADESKTWVVITTAISITCAHYNIYIFNPITSSLQWIYTLRIYISSLPFICFTILQCTRICINHRFLTSLYTMLFLHHLV